MAYRELAAPGPPAHHVACLWMRDPEPVARLHRVLPDACADVVWIAGRLSVAGPATGPLLSEVPAGGLAIGVRFRVGAAGSALGLPARELLDRTVALEDVWGPAGRELAERLDAAPSPDAALALLATAVGRRLAAADALDPLVRAAAVRAADPRATVDGLAAGLGLGERQLRRRFGDAVGYGPKTLQRVLRLQRFLALARTPGPAGEPPDLARLAADAGYADQSHLTRECRRLAGLPPSVLLAGDTGPSGERSDGFVPGDDAGFALAA